MLRMHGPSCDLPMRALLLAVLMTMLSGCSLLRDSPPDFPRRTVPSSAPLPDNAGGALVGVASQFIGSPYRYGGMTPRGFDCSGLVHYTHDLIGREVPRTAREQSRAARSVDVDDLEPGDLVFFRISSRKVDHVGIYAGDGRFIHAPSTGGAVTYGYLDDPYYRRHFTRAGRLW